MFCAVIHDDELLPISEQLDLLDHCSKGSLANEPDALREVIERIHHQLNRDFSGEKITVFDYIDFSLRLNRHNASLTELH